MAAASKDHVGTGAPARPVERSSTSGTIAFAGCGASLRRADEGVRPYVDVLILPDSVFRFVTGEFGRLAPQNALSRTGITCQCSENADITRKLSATCRLFAKAFREVGRRVGGSAGALYSPYLLARNLPTSDSIWP